MNLGENDGDGPTPGDVDENDGGGFLIDREGVSTAKKVCDSERQRAIRVHGHRRSDMVTAEDLWLSLR